MKKIISFIIIIVSFLGMNSTIIKQCLAQDEAYLLSIVIDDFGEDRNGVEEMLSISLPLTCAIMPNLTYSTQDAEKATSLGHEVILHMPLEAKGNLPPSWYGPSYINHNDTPQSAQQKVEEALKTVPNAKGINFHMGAALNHNSKLINQIIQYTKQNDLYFLDSKTDINSICKQVCLNNQACFLERDEFLEVHGTKSTAYAQQKIKDAIKTAKTKGYAIVIGHVGPEGGISTANAIKNSIQIFEENNVKVVPVSTIYNKLKQVI